MEKYIAQKIKTDIKNFIIFLFILNILIKIFVIYNKKYQLSTTNLKLTSLGKKKELGKTEFFFYYTKVYKEFLLSKSFINATNFLTPSIGIAL